MRRSLRKYRSPRLRPVVSHGVHGPCVFDYEKRYPMPLIDVAEIDAAEYYGDCVDDKKTDIEFDLVARDLFVVGHVEEKFPQAPHTLLFFETTLRFLPPGQHRGHGALPL